MRHSNGGWSWKRSVADRSPLPVGPLTDERAMGGFVKRYRDAGDQLAIGVLDAFAGRLVVRVLERRPGAVVLERLEPGTPLSTLVANGQDEEATRILTRTIQQLRADSIPAGVPTAAELGAGFATYLDSGDRQLPPSIVRDAYRVHGELCASQTGVRLLHGDLHHDNVLFDTRHGWVAIDPKGVIGETEYELSAPLRNPVERPDVFGDLHVFEHRVDLFARELRLNRERIRQWTFAAAVLAAIWTIEDDDDPALRERWIAFADAIRR